MKRYYLACLFSLFSLSSYATPQVVTKQTCNTLHSPTKPFMMILKKGDELIPSIIACAEKANLKAATFTGIGALEDPTIAYYDAEAKQYNNKSLSGMFELITLQGNLSTLQQKPQIHIHVGLGDENYQMLAGHLQSATVGFTTELTVTPFSKPIIRSKDKETGLNLIAS